MRHWLVVTLDGVVHGRLGGCAAGRACVLAPKPNFEGGDASGGGATAAAAAPAVHAPNANAVAASSARLAAVKLSVLLLLVRSGVHVFACDSDALVLHDPWEALIGVLRLEGGGSGGGGGGDGGGRGVGGGDDVDDLAWIGGRWRGGPADEFEDEKALEDEASSGEASSGEAAAVVGAADPPPPPPSPAVALLLQEGSLDLSHYAEQQLEGAPTRAVLSSIAVSGGSAEAMSFLATVGRSLLRMSGYADETLLRQQRVLASALSKAESTGLHWSLFDQRSFPTYHTLARMVDCGSEESSVPSSVALASMSGARDAETQRYALREMRLWLLDDRPNLLLRGVGAA